MDERLAARLRIELVRHPHFAQRGPFTLSPTGAVSGHRTRLTTVELRFAAERERYWIKRYLDGGDARKEAAFLERRVRAAGIELVGPAVYLEALGALVTPHVDGELLSDRFHGGDRLAAVRSDCAAAGAWLAALHDCEPDAGPHPRDALMHDVERRLAAVSSRFPVPDALKVRVLDETRRRLEGASAEELRRVLTHGDFAPFNLIIGPSGGRVLDPSFERSIDRLDNRCARFEDAARFVTCLELSESLDAEERRQAIAAFLDGYEGAPEGHVLRAPLFAALRLKYRLQALLDRWRSAETARSRRGTAPLLESWLDDDEPHGDSTAASPSRPQSANGRGTG